MSRNDAIDKISKPELDEETMKKEFEYIAKKLDFTIDEFNDIFSGENKSFRDYKNNFFWITLGARIANLLGIDNRSFR